MNYKLVLAIFLGTAMPVCMAQSLVSTNVNRSAIPTSPSAESAEQTESSGETQNSTSNAARPPIPESLIKMGQLSAKFDMLNPGDWEMPFPSTGDTVIGDAGGIRSALAEHGFGVRVWAMNGIQYNLKDAPMAGMPLGPDGQRSQVYSGQKPTWVPGAQNVWVTYNTPTTHTQFVVGVTDSGTTWAPAMAGTGLRVNDLFVMQRFWNDKLKVSFGYLYNDSTYYEGYIGGSLGGGSLGENAILPYEVGQSHGGMISPGLNLRYKVSEHFYGITGFQRSINPDGYGANIRHDSVNLRFSNPGSRLLLIQEVGYRKQSAPGVKNLFLRADGWFNFSHFLDFRSGSLALLTASSDRKNRTDNNFAVSFAADRQLYQPDPSLPFRGFYAGGSVQYAPPQQNLFSQYYEVRLYSIGMFNRRPTDMLSLDINNTQFSKIALRTFAGTAAYGVSNPSAQLGIPTYFTGSTTCGGNWAWHLKPGVYFNTGMQYVVHPTYTPKLPSPVLGIAGLVVFF